MVNGKMTMPNYFSTFPVKDKRPLVKWDEFQRRLPTKQELDQWEKSYPNGDKGIVCGKISKIFVLDDDGGLDLKRYNIPRTWTTKTPRGGRHYYFRWIPELDKKVTTKTNVLEKVDVRGEGGFVVSYPWEKPISSLQIANPPQWLIDILPNQIQVMSSPIMQKFEEIKEGNRNDTFTRLAGGLRARGYKPEEMFEFLKGKAIEVNFSEKELWSVCESVGRYEPKTVDVYASSIESFLEDQEKVEWIVPGVIAKKSIVFVAGLPETGKTWMLIDLAIECSKGEGLWLGKFPLKKAKVLFIDQERFRGETQRRFKAVLIAKSLAGSDLKDTLFVRCGTTTRLDLQHSFDAFRKELADLRPDLVIIDSFATFHTREENNRKDIQEVLEKIKQLRNEFGCTFIFIDHENKGVFNDKESNEEPSAFRMVGSIAKPAAAETIFTVRRNDSESSMVYHTKSTLASTIAPFLVKVTDQDENKTKIKVEAF